MKILITGSTGFIGKTLVPYLSRFRKEDTIGLLVRNVPKAQSLFSYVPVHIININEKHWENEVIKFNADVVIHMATLFNKRCDAESAQQIIYTNITLSTLLLEAVSHTDCSSFINIGTFTEFLYGAGNYFPNNLYSATKTALRPIIQFYQTQSAWKWINLIVYSPYGRKNENKKVLDYMVEALDSPHTVKFTKGEQILDFIHVDDIADFFMTLLNKLPEIKQPFSEFHIGSGTGYSIREVGGIMEKVFEKKLNADWGGLPYGKYEPMHAVAPIAQNIEILNWKAKIKLEEGLAILKNDIDS